MNKQSPVPLATDTQVAEAEAALNAFDHDARGITAADIKAWAEARKTNPDAECPPARRLR